MAEETRIIPNVSEFIEISKDGKIYVDGEYNPEMGNVPLMTGGVMDAKTAAELAFPESE